jgi:hypothetical protein
MSYTINIKRAGPFLEWAVSALSGDANISFEGSFPIQLFDHIPGARTSPDEVLKRQTFYPETDFLILPLRNETKEIILKSVLPRIGLRQNVYHIQVEQHGRLVLEIIDNLQHCWLGANIQQHELVTLKDNSVIRSFMEHSAAT